VLEYARSYRHPPDGLKKVTLREMYRVEVDQTSRERRRLRKGDVSAAGTTPHSTHGRVRRPRPRGMPRVSLSLGMAATIRVQIG
jgi:hypothetical protein